MQTVGIFTGGISRLSVINCLGRRKLANANSLMLDIGVNNLERYSKYLFIDQRNVISQ
jgi:hypothetical protein